MKKFAGMVVVILVLSSVGFWGYRALPPAYNPFAPLAPTDAPTWVTRYKLRQLASDPAACLSVLNEAQRLGMIAFRPAPAVRGACPLNDVVRVSSFGDVTLSNSFLASCPLALSSARYINQRAAPAALAVADSPLRRIDHYGSFACRNIYHLPNARRSEHASADALDISGFRLANGQRISVARDWHNDGEKGVLLRRWFSDSCAFYGNALGPNYNAAHADHFHLGMRGSGFCR